MVERNSNETRHPLNVSVRDDDDSWNHIATVKEYMPKWVNRHESGYSGAKGFQPMPWRLKTTGDTQRRCFDIDLSSLLVFV